MKNYYKRFYSKFDEARYRKLMNGFGLDENRKLRTFSKGMKKQVRSSAAYAAARTTYSAMRRSTVSTRSFARR